MRIAIDARYLGEEFSGIGVYSQNLVEALAREETTHEFVVFVHKDFHDKLDVGDNFEVVSERARPVSIRTVATMQDAFRRHDIDLLHSLFPLVPFAWRKKLLLHVHDLQPLLDPDFTGNRSPWLRFLYDSFYQFSYPAALRHADYIASDSFATKASIRRLLPECGEKTLVVYGGVPAEAREVPSEDFINQTRKKYDLPQRFIFYIGSTRPNKNLLNMLEAFEDYTRKKPEDEDLIWVMVVNQDRFFEPIFARIRERGLLGRVRILEQISEAEKVAFYRMASLLYFVTKFEGFGLPVLEAQAQSLPVLASTHSALPEVAGRAAILVDADEPDEITAGLERFFSDPDLRTKMIETGLENVKRFTWQKTAKDVLAMYDHLFT
ncbi:hypothetical protein CVU37_08335 [candidate division BRC1 bacterium HGW-BRC1-1]|jgi:glycosyltransferase involved in cell wall biosynthesis|nr:MAG: hypothetical protein CVU37_08335 [candidate division BRC1 bacterium HGW-BRC1-1]